jgi:hypothetical protein
LQELACKDSIVRLGLRRNAILHRRRISLQNSAFEENYSEFGINTSLFKYCARTAHNQQDNDDNYQDFRRNGKRRHSSVDYLSLTLSKSLRVVLEWIYGIEKEAPTN